MCSWEGTAFLTFTAGRQESVALTEATWLQAGDCGRGLSSVRAQLSYCPGLPLRMSQIRDQIQGLKNCQQGSKLLQLPGHQTDMLELKHFRKERKQMNVPLL